MGKANGPLILCVDDDPLFLRSLVRMLDGAGLRVRTAGSGTEALQAVHDHSPDLVLLDVRMPGMDGYEVCARLQADEGTAQLPVLFVTALESECDKARALCAGAADYLVKPIDEESLVAKVHEHLETGARWKSLAPDAASRARIQPSDFVRFREFLAARLADDEATGKRCASLAPGELYDLAREKGIAAGLMAQWIAEALGLPYVQDIDPDDIALGVLPTQFCRSNRVVALDAGNGSLEFVVSNPFLWEVLDLLRPLVAPGTQPTLKIAAPNAFKGLFESGTGAVEINLVDESDADTPIHTSEAQATPAAAHGPTDVFDLLASSSAPAIQLANEVIAEAVATRASDIHLEPREDEVGLRYRVDGMLMPRRPIPKAMQASLLSRVKIMARLNIAERRVPQDGRVRVLYEGRPVDLRVSTLPTRHGEKIVMRVLDKGAVSLQLDALGLEESTTAAMRESIAKPHGILLVTGPTGSGKTTTLYAVLTALNQPHANVVTVEDPIEYELARVNQVQVHPPAGLTFPVALRSILRQDPDIIMVGEIRDGETLDIAMKAALTGHLVLSTLHTNDAVSTISRLVDMGSEPFMVASTVEMISAQRLLRRLCDKCREPAKIPDEILKKFGVPVGKDARFFKAKGCPECNQVGYRGRLAVAEVLLLDENLRQMVARSAESGAIREYIFRSVGMSTLRQNAFRKAAAGLTTLEEVLRVTA